MQYKTTDPKQSHSSTSANNVSHDAPEKVKFKTYNEKNLCHLFSRNVTGTEEYFILITASNVMTDFYVKHVKVY